MSSSKQNSTRLNSNEQQIEIENRLKELFDCLKISDQIQNNTELSKLKVKDELNKINKIFEIQFIKNQINNPIRDTENSIHQLVGKLNSLSFLNGSEKFLCLKQIDISIQEIKENLKSIENYRKSHLDNFYLDQNQLFKIVKKQLKNIPNVIQTESQMLHLDEDDEYANWLLINEKNKSDLKKANSYEFINYDNEWAEILEYDDYEMEKNKIFNVKQRFGLDKTDSITKFFNEIYAKPIDHWLLK